MSYTSYAITATVFFLIIKLLCNKEELSVKNCCKISIFFKKKFTYFGEIELVAMLLLPDIRLTVPVGQDHYLV